MKNRIPPTRAAASRAIKMLNTALGPKAVREIREKEKKGLLESSSWCDMDLPEEVFEAMENVIGALDIDPSDTKATTIEMEKVAKYIRGLHARIDALEGPLEFKFKPGRPLMVVKMGSEARGWIPSEEHFDHVVRVLKESGVDETHNILVTNYGIQIEIR